MNIEILTDSNNHFDTLILSSRGSGFSSADFVRSEFHKYGINLRKVDEDLVGISVNETTTILDVEELLEIFAEMREVSDSGVFNTHSFYEEQHYEELQPGIKRESEFMKQA